MFSNIFSSVSYVRAPQTTRSSRAETPVTKLGSPVRASARIATLDILRGFALLGILAVNIETFAGPESLHDIPMGVAHAAFVGWHATLDLVILTVKWLFVEGKMRGMFAMLFGASAVLLLQRVDRHPYPARGEDTFFRRNLWLALFGFLHGTLIWFGDILLVYALCGLLVVYPLRHVSARKLIPVGMFLWVVVGTFGLTNLPGAGDVLGDESRAAAAISARDAGRPLTTDQRALLAQQAKTLAEAPAEIARAIEDGRAGYLAAMPGHAGEYLDIIAGFFRSGWVAEIFGAILLGMGLYKAGFLSGRATTATYVTTIVLGYAISMPIVLYGIFRANAEGFSPAAVIRWMYLPYEIQTLAGMLANASVLLLLTRVSFLQSALGGLGAVGRTAFSNYIATSLLCQFIFAWGPWKLFGALEYYQLLYVVGAIWVLNVVVSSFWLKAFEFGPLEWAWRSLTYWQRQPFLRVGG